MPSIEFNFDEKRFRQSLTDEVARVVADEVTRRAKEAGADRFTYRCEDDGWTTTASTEATLRQRIRQHYRSSRHKF